jgi:peptidyl-prolyl cis-trans isomerase SurA
MVIQYEDDHLESKYKDFSMLMNEYRDGILLFDLMDEMVWTKAVKDTVGYMKYYNEHRDDYRWGKRVDASYYTFSDPSVFDTVEAMVKLGRSDEQILAAINNDSLKQVKYVHKKFSKGDLSEVDETKWKVGTYKVFRNDKGVALNMVRILAKLKPVNKEIDECRGMLISDYQNVLEKEWITELKAKFPVVVNEEVLKDLKSNGLTE